MHKVTFFNSFNFWFCIQFCNFRTIRTFSEPVGIKGWIVRKASERVERTKIRVFLILKTNSKCELVEHTCHVSVLIKDTKRIISRRVPFFIRWVTCIGQIWLGLWRCPCYLFTSPMSWTTGLLWKMLRVVFARQKIKSWKKPFYPKCNDFTTVSEDKQRTLSKRHVLALFVSIAKNAPI